MLNKCKICGNVGDLFSAVTGEDVCSICKIKFIGGLPTTQERINELMKPFEEKPPEPTDDIRSIEIQGNLYWMPKAEANQLIAEFIQYLYDQQSRIKKRNDGKKDDKLEEEIKKWELRSK